MTRQGSVGSALALALLMGCVSVERSYPEKRRFVLDASRRESPSRPADGPVLTVRKFRVSPRYENRGFVYRRGDLRYESDFYNEFLISPASLLTEEVRRGLSASGIFKQVVSPGSPLESIYVLEGRVSALYGDYRDGGSPKAVLGMRFFLVKEATPRPRIILRKESRREISVEDGSPNALVKGWNEALRQILVDLKKDLGGVDFRKHR